MRYLFHEDELFFLERDSIAANESALEKFKSAHHFKSRQRNYEALKRYFVWDGGVWKHKRSTGDARTIIFDEYDFEKVCRHMHHGRRRSKNRMAHLPLGRLWLLKSHDVAIIGTLGSFFSRRFVFRRQKKRTRGYVRGSSRFFLNDIPNKLFQLSPVVSIKSIANLRRDV